MPDVSSPITHGHLMRMPSLIDYVPFPTELVDPCRSRSSQPLDSLCGCHLPNYDSVLIRKGDNVVTPMGHYCTVLGVSMAGRATIAAEDGTVIAMDLDRLQKVKPKYVS